MNKQKGEPDWAQAGTDQTYSTSGDAEIARQSVTDGEIQAAVNILKNGRDHVAYEGAFFGFTREYMSALDLAIAAIRSYKPEPCEWTVDEDGIWNSTCGSTWILTNGGPAEHGGRKLMTIKQLYAFTKCSIKILDGRDDKILCYSYKPDRHDQLSDREVLSIWAEIAVKNGGFDSFARPVICVYVAHLENSK